MKRNFAKILIVTIFILIGCNPQKSSEIAQEDQISKLEKEHTLEKESYADSVNAGLIEDTFKGSARRETKATIGNTEIKINYGSPGVRGRVIWNGLVSYDQVWVSGSHWATAVNFSENVLVNGVEIPAGMYGFFSIPGREEWTLIINKVYDMHLADDYDENKDLVRLTVKPEILETSVQRLTYDITKGNDGFAYISLSWDNIKVGFPVQIK